MLIGLNFDYENINMLHLGIRYDDFGELSIIWILFIFLMYQKESFNNKIFLKYSHKLDEIVA